MFLLLAECGAASTAAVVALDDVDGSLDAGCVVDASATDGGLDAPDAGSSDAEPDAAAGIGPGETCPTGVGCAPGLLCWYVPQTYDFLCTHPCGDEGDCSKFGPACCFAPGGPNPTTVRLCAPIGLGVCD